VDQRIIGSRAVRLFSHVDGLANVVRSVILIVKRARRRRIHHQRQISLFRRTFSSTSFRRITKVEQANISGVRLSLGSTAGTRFPAASGIGIEAASEGILAAHSVDGSHLAWLLLSDFGVYSRNRCYFRSAGTLGRLSWRHSPPIS